MVDWKDRCPEINPCGRGDCPRCAPSSILPSAQRGRSKPNRRANTSKETGYRVYRSGAAPDKIESFSTPDVAIAMAESRSKRDQNYYVISRNGTQWLMVKWDGSMEEIK